MLKIEFDKPHTFEGKEYAELQLDLDNLSGRDLISAGKEARAMGDNSPVVELSKIYHAVVAAKAARVPADLILSLPVKEFTRVTMAVQDFLLG